MVAPDTARQARQTWIIYDTCRIGSLVPNSFPKGYANPAMVAADDHVPFLDVRQSSEVGKAYTNITSKSKLPWPFDLESIGVRFVYPNPYNSGIVVNADAAAKAWQEILPDHSWIEFGIREDTWLINKCSMTPPGYGPSGMAMYTNWQNNSFVSVEGQGNQAFGNRFRWIEGTIRIPADTPIWAKIYFSEYAKQQILNRIQLLPLDFKEGEDASGEDTTPNELSIEVTLRGVRRIQQVGEYFAS
jgi:hypothetical protein